MSRGVARLCSILALALLVVSAACSSSSGGSTSTSGGDKLKVAIIFPGNIQDASWNQQVYQAAKKLESEGKIQLTFKENVADADSERELRGYAQAGNQLIIAHSFGYGEAGAFKVAKEFPKVAFCWAGSVGNDVPGIKGLDTNLCDYEQPFHEPAYILGVLAGGMTKTNTIGAQGGFDIPACHSMTEAYFAGAKSVNPNIKGVPGYANDWVDVAKNKELARSQADQGADFFMACGEGPALGQIAIAQERKLLATGYVGDMSVKGPDVVVASMIWHFDVILNKMVEDVKGNKFIGAQNGTAPYYKYNVSNGGLSVELTPSLKSRVPDDVQKKVQQAQDDIKSGKIKVPYVPK